MYLCIYSYENYIQLFSINFFTKLLDTNFIRKVELILKEDLKYGKYDFEKKIIIRHFNILSDFMDLYKTTLGSFKFDQEIQDVFKVHHKLTNINPDKTSSITNYKGVTGNIEVIVKFFDKVFIEKREIDYILNKAKVLLQLNHPKIQKFYGLYQQKLNNVKRLGLVYDYIDGVTLEDYIRNNKDKITDLDKIRFAIEIAELLEYIHSKDIIYRDIRTSKMLVFNNQIYFTWFNMALISKEKIVDIEDIVEGLPYHCPPEAFSDISDENSVSKFHLTTKYDIWSIGTLILELFTGEAAWTARYQDHFQVIMALSKDLKFKGYDYPFPNSFIVDYPDIFNIVQQCMVRSVEKRICINDLLSLLRGLEKQMKDLIGI